MKTDSKKFQIIFFILLIIALHLIVAMIFTSTQKNDLTAQDDIIDMRNYSFAGYESYSLGRAFSHSKTFSSGDYTVYSLTVQLPEDVKNVSFLIPATITNLSFVVNSETIYSQSKDSMPYPYERLISYKCNNQTLHLRLYVDNERIINSPLTNPTRTSNFLIGTNLGIYTKNHIANLLSLVVLIICGTSAVFHFLLFVSRNYNRMHLYFCVLSFAVALSFLLNKSSLLDVIFPDIDITLGYRLYNFANTLRAIGFLAFVKEALAEYKSKKIITALLYLCLVTLLPIFVVNNMISSLLSIFINMIFFISIVLSLVIIIRNKIYNRSSEMFLLSIGIILLLFGAFSELLYIYSLSAVNSMVAYCMIVFIIIQSFIIFIDYHNSINNISLLSNNLSETMHDLQSNRSTFISSHIEPSFVYNALDSINESCGKNDSKTDKLIQSLAKYLRQSLDFSADSDNYMLKSELELCEAYAYLIADQKPEIKITIKYDNDLPSSSFIQMGILSLVDNSVNYAFDGVLQPKIHVNASYDIDENKINIEVSDNGIGMSLDEIRKYLSIPNKHLSVGLYSINQYLLEREQNELIITSGHRKGTTISFSLTPDGKEEEDAIY